MNLFRLVFLELGYREWDGEGLRVDSEGLLEDILYEEFIIRSVK